MSTIPRSDQQRPPLNRCVWLPVWLPRDRCVPTDIRISYNSTSLPVLIDKVTFAALVDLGRDPEGSRFFLGKRVVPLDLNLCSSAEQSRIRGQIAELARTPGRVVPQPVEAPAQIPVEAPAQIRDPIVKQINALKNLHIPELVREFHTAPRPPILHKALSEMLESADNTFRACSEKRLNIRQLSEIREVQGELKSLQKRFQQFYRIMRNFQDITPFRRKIEEVGAVFNAIPEAFQPTEDEFASIIFPMQVQLESWEDSFMQPEIDRIAVQQEIGKMLPLFQSQLDRLMEELALKEKLAEEFALQEKRALIEELTGGEKLGGGGMSPVQSRPGILIENLARLENPAREKELEEMVANLVGK